MAYEVQRLEDSRVSWQEANYRAETEIARLQSLGRIEEEATARLKMVPAKESIPILLANPIQVRTPPVEPARSASPKGGRAEPWWQGLADLVNQVRGSP